MPYDFYRKEIAEKVFFNRITDKRYKINRISVSFFTRLDVDKSSVNALIPRLISKSCARFPDPKDFHNYEASLYSAKVNFNVGAIGDTQRLELSVTSIDDAFALNGEKITEEAAKLISDCILNPALSENNVFNKEYVETDKKAQIEAIEAELNEKRVYAVNRAYETLCEGEPCAVSKQGTIKKTAEITAETLFKAYKKLLSSAQIEIICVGSNEFSDTEKKIIERFGSIVRENAEDCVSEYSILKSEIAEKTEKLQVTQSKMVLGFKTDSKSFPALMLMTKLYGGTATSKLFMNVREKLSLCYYCWGRFNKDKGVMIVECGVESENIEKAKAEILKQLDDVKKGNFTDEDIQNSLLSVQNDTKTVNDSLGSLSEWYLAHIYRKDIKSPEESLPVYGNVTRRDIENAAKTLKLDTVYVLTGTEES